MASKTDNNIMRDELEKFHHTVGILVKAYLNDTLVHQNCYACAVGNLVACGLGTKLVKVDNHYSFHNIIWDNNEPYPATIDYTNIHRNGWGALFSTSDDSFTNRRRQEIDKEHLKSERVQKHIEATGYTWKELARIERAFESYNKRKKDKMIDGLMRVVDVLADIHKIDLSIKEEAKALFVK